MFTPPELADRITNTASELGISVRQLLLKTGLNKNTLSNLRNGSAIQYDSLGKIAIVLGVSLDYLVGMSDFINIGTLQCSDEREQNLINHFRALDLDGKASVEHVALEEHRRVKLEGDSTSAAN